MIELRTLGTVDLVQSDGVRIDALLRRPKRLALLAFLASARPDATYRREKLLAMFWPETDETRGRGSLRQSIHVIRQHLGAAAVVALGDEELSLAPGVLRCDAIEFERAIREGRLSEAVAAYGGEFLPGFYLDDAADFAEWLDSTRHRLRDLATNAAVTVAEQSWLAGNYAACIQAARRAVAIAPGDERATRRLVSALDHTGDRGAAVAAYETLAHRLHADFEVFPSAETQALIAVVRARALAGEPIDVFPHVDVQPARSAAGMTAERTSEAEELPGARGLVRYGRNVMRTAAVAAVLLLNGSRSRTAEKHVTPAVVPAEARDAYARARFYLAKPTETNLLHAVLLFERALDAEPLYAPAYAGLGDAYLRLGYGSYLAPSDAFPKALAAARHAIEMDSLAPEAHATLAFAQMYYEWDWAAAEREFKLATRLGPQYALAHAWYAYLLSATGRDSAAQQEVEIARRLAPLSVAIAVDAGFVSFYANDLAGARRRLESALLMAPEVPTAHLWLGRVAQQEGNLKRARMDFDASGALTGWVPTIVAVAYVDALLGDRASARRALVRLDSLSHSRYVTPYGVALVHVALDERDSAFHWLNRSVSDRAHWLVWLQRDHRWDPLRRDPRFAELVKRVGLPL